jgi:hypothetical protein
MAAMAALTRLDPLTDALFAHEVERKLSNPLAHVSSAPSCRDRTKPGTEAEHGNLLLTGPCGIGKSWLSCALAQKACRDGYTVLYDDWGPDRLTANQRRDLMEIVEDRYGRGATLITRLTTKRSRGDGCRVLTGGRKSLTNFVIRSQFVRSFWLRRSSERRQKSMIRYRNASNVRPCNVDCSRSEIPWVSSQESHCQRPHRTGAVLSGGFSGISLETGHARFTAAGDDQGPHAARRTDPPQSLEIRNRGDPRTNPRRWLLGTVAAKA